MRPLTASGQQRRGLAWIARRSVPGEAACARLGADVVDMMSGPSDRFVDLALLTLACSVGEITWLVGKFYDFDHTSAIVEMIRTLVKNAFPTKEGQP